MQNAKCKVQNCFPFDFYTERELRGGLISSCSAVKRIWRIALTYRKSTHRYSNIIAQWKEKVKGFFEIGGGEFEKYFLSVSDLVERYAFGELCVFIAAILRDLFDHFDMIGQGKALVLARKLDLEYGAVVPERIDVDLDDVVIKGDAISRFSDRLLSFIRVQKLGGVCIRVDLVLVLEGRKGRNALFDCLDEADSAAFVDPAHSCVLAALVFKIGLLDLLDSHAVETLEQLEIWHIYKKFSLCFYRYIIRHFALHGKSAVYSYNLSGYEGRSVRG